jgi:hypothetical protein
MFWAIAVLIGAFSYMYAHPKLPGQRSPVVNMPNRSISGQTYYNSWDLKPGVVQFANPANNMMFPQAKVISANSGNMVYSKTWLDNYTKLQAKNLYRTPTELGVTQQNSSANVVKYTKIEGYKTVGQATGRQLLMPRYNFQAKTRFNDSRMVGHVISPYQH